MRERHWRHGITGAGYINKNINGMYECPYCTNCFPSRNGLGQHIAYRHQGIKVEFYKNRKTWNKGLKTGIQKLTYKKILEGKINYNPTLFKYLIERDGEKCSECGLTTWNGKYIKLDVHHNDGNNKNNLPDNLRLLCPNCHRQTDTWGNKNRGE